MKTQTWLWLAAGVFALDFIMAKRASAAFVARGNMVVDSPASPLLGIRYPFS